MKIIFTLSFFLIFAKSYSQELWTLEKCINYAVDNNIQLKTQKLQIDINKNQALQSKLDLLPSLNVGIGEGISFGRKIDQYTNDFASDNIYSTNFQVSSSMILFSGLRKYYNIQKSEIEHKSSYLLFEKSKNDLIIMITLAYLNILFDTDLFEAVIQQKDITEQQLVKTKKLVESGSISVQNQYELEAQLAIEELNIINAENGLKYTKLVLAQLLEINNVEDFYVAHPNMHEINPESSILSVDQIFEEALMKMPQIENAKLIYKSAENNLAITRSYLMPTLSVNFAYGTGFTNVLKSIDQLMEGSQSLVGTAIDNDGNSFNLYQSTYNYTYKTMPLNDQLKNNASTYLSFNVSIPVFNGFQIKTQINNSKIYLEQSGYLLEQAKKDLFKEIQQAHSDAQAALKKYFATEKTLKAIEMNFEYARKKYDQGLLNTTDYNVAKNNLAKTEIELLGSKYEFVFKQKILDFYRNKNITF